MTISLKMEGVRSLRPVFDNFFSGHFAEKMTRFRGLNYNSSPTCKVFEYILLMWLDFPQNDHNGHLLKHGDDAAGYFCPKLKQRVNLTWSKK